MHQLHMLNDVLLNQTVVQDIYLQVTKMFLTYNQCFSFPKYINQSSMEKIYIYLDQGKPGA